jgi:transcriptional regulator with GAF, ATPase, and Fis domain
LRVFPIVIPPLRQRKEDIPALVQHFIGKKAREMKRSSVPVLALGAMDQLLRYPWPGNARELENAVERALIVNRDGPLSFNDIDTSMGAAYPSNPPPVGADTAGPMELDLVVSRHIRKVLAMSQGRVEGDKGAARLLGVHPSTLRKRMRKLGIVFGRKGAGKYSTSS